MTRIRRVFIANYRATLTDGTEVNHKIVLTRRSVAYDLLDAFVEDPSPLAGYVSSRLDIDRNAEVELTDVEEHRLYRGDLDTVLEGLEADAPSAPADTDDLMPRQHPASGYLSSLPEADEDDEDEDTNMGASEGVSSARRVRHNDPLFSPVMLDRGAQDKEDDEPQNVDQAIDGVIASLEALRHHLRR